MAQGAPSPTAVRATSAASASLFSLEAMWNVPFFVGSPTSTRAMRAYGEAFPGRMGPACDGNARPHPGMPPGVSP